MRKCERCGEKKQYLFLGQKACRTPRTCAALLQARKSGQTVVEMRLGCLSVEDVLGLPVEVTR